MTELKYPEQDDQKMAYMTFSIIKDSRRFFFLSLSLFLSHTHTHTIRYSYICTHMAVRPKFLIDKLNQKSYVHLLYGFLKILLNMVCFSFSKFAFANAISPYARYIFFLFLSPSLRTAGYWET